MIHPVYTATLPKSEVSDIHLMNFSNTSPEMIWQEQEWVKEMCWPLIQFIEIPKLFLSNSTGALTTQTPNPFKRFIPNNTWCGLV